jgi:hypothetical protein
MRAAVLDPDVYSGHDSLAVRGGYVQDDIAEPDQGVNTRGQGVDASLVRILNIRDWADIERAVVREQGEAQAHRDG